MELDVLVQKIQRKLLENEKKISEIDSAREGVTKTCKEEQEKVEELTAAIQSKVVAAGEVLKEKTKKEFNKLDKAFAGGKQEIVTDSSLLSQELKEITELVKNDEVYTFDMEECWRKIKDALSRSDYEVFTKMPAVYPSKTLAKIKSSDLGYFCMDEYFPQEYRLVLTSSVYNVEASDNCKVICNVNTDRKFTAKVQANIKFSIKNKMFKDSVPYCKEECKLSQDEKSFQICFLAQKPGVYLVTVLLYDQQIADSPLTLFVNENKSEQINRNAIEVDTAGTVMQQQEFKNLVVTNENKSDKIKRNAMEVDTAGTVMQQLQDSAVTNVCSEITKFVDQGFSSNGPREDIDVPYAPQISNTLSMSPPNQTNTTPPNQTNATPPNQTNATPPNQTNATPPNQTNATPPNQTNATPPNQTNATPLNLSTLAQGGKKVSAQKVFGIEEGTKPETLHRPIGMCLLHNGNIVVASTFENLVKMYSASGVFISLVESPEGPFTHPSDMVTLQSGQFVVRDNTRVQVFSPVGKYMRTLWQDEGKDRCYGLAQDKEERLVTVMESRRPRRTDLLLFDLNSGEFVKKIDMEDIIKDKLGSKCRFLTYQLDKLYITDLGLDCVYVLDPATLDVKVFGTSGTSPGQLSDPAGLVVDSVGNMIVADSKNHRLCLFEVEGNFLGNVHLRPEARRPSGVVLDIKNRELYVLTLNGKVAMTKYSIK